MSEQTPETPAASSDPAAQPAPPVEPEDKTDWKSEARKWEQRAKDNSGAAKTAEKERLASMGEAERKIEEAKATGRSEAVGEFGKRLARTEFDALAGRRNPDVDIASVLEYVDLARFVAEDGEPDTKAITAAVERLVPASSGAPPSFDGGARSTPPAPADMNRQIRSAAGRA